MKKYPLTLPELCLLVLVSNVMAEAIWALIGLAFS